MLALASVQFTFFVDMEMDIVGKEEEGMTRSSCSQKIVCWQRMMSARAGGGKERWRYLVTCEHWSWSEER